MRGDDSCDWHGRARPLSGREMEIIESLDCLETVIGNRPVFGSDLFPGTEDPGPLGGAYGDLNRAIHDWRKRDRRWWQHPRWHIHHWKIQIHPLQEFKRWAFSRCSECGGRFAWGEAPLSSSWHSSGPRWFRSEKGIRHCPSPATEKVSPGAMGREE
ncbi:MAG: hypothetical protein V3V08_05345 [Nannocystaceae bacterium]